MYNFELEVDRKGSNSVKWDSVNDNEIPMWIADMDFMTPQVVIDSLENRVKHGVFGYTMISDEYYQAEVDWWKKRHGIKIQKEWIEVSTGIIPSLSSVIQAMCDPEDKVLIQSPVYNYFDTSITNNRCTIVRNKLMYIDNHYEIDFAQFESHASDEKVKLFILCNPHNPVGRVWTEDELRRMGEICIRHDVIVLVDEAHRDLVLSGHKHVSFLSLSKDFSMNSITCTSPGKTFNLAGLKVSNIITANNELRQKINRSININEVIEPNVFGTEGLIAAYNQGHEWLDQLLIKLDENVTFTKDFIQEKLPQITMIQPEGTYLIWLDCMHLHFNSVELTNLLSNYGLRVNGGNTYGIDGDGFIRLNIACPLITLREGLKRLEQAINSINKC